MTDELPDVPRSPTGRVPQWVLDEATGRTVEPSPWRAEPVAPPGTRWARPRRRLRVPHAVVVVVVAMAVTVAAASWPGFVERMNPWAGHAAPLGTPEPPAGTSSSYAFLTVQDDGVSPVAYDPCRPVHVAVNPRGEPAGGRQLILDAIDRISRATGLQFVVDADTSEEPSVDRSTTVPLRYGADRWAPVLVAWTTPEVDPDLSGAVAGTGGSAATGRVGGPMVYVTGRLHLDAPQLQEVLDTRPDGEAVVRTIVVHELAHVVGLDHVDDPTQVMHPETQPGVTELGAGDLTGLALLGTGACVPNL